MRDNTTTEAPAHGWRSIDDYEDEQEPAIDLVAVFRVLVLGKRTIAAFAAICLAIATVIAFVLPPSYTSVTSFIPPAAANSSSMLSSLAGQLSPLGAGDLLGGTRTSGDLYAGILKSKSVLGELVRRFDLVNVYHTKRESQAEEALLSSTKITIDAKSSIVTLSVTAKSPELAQKLARAYMDVLHQTNGRLAVTQSSQRRLFFEQQLANEKNDLADAEVELKKTEESSGLIAPAGQTEAQIRTIAETQAQIAARQVQLAALRQSSTEENPEVIRVKSEISNLQKQLAELQRGAGGPSIATAKVPAAQLEYIRKARDVKYHEALFEALSKQYEAARLDESRDAPVLQVLDPASLPDMKSAPKRSLIMLGGMILGLIIGSVIVLVKGRAFSLGEARSTSAR